MYKKLGFESPKLDYCLQRHIMTISFLREILRYYEVTNNLDRHLSALSTYKHPRMEEIYEIARVSSTN